MEGVRAVDELIKLVSKKTGLSEEMSRMAVETVLGYLKDRLPDPIAGQIDSVLGGAGPAAGLGDLAKGLGGILGKK
jgi:hypothetical protein